MKHAARTRHGSKARSSARGEGVRASLGSCRLSRVGRGGGLRVTISSRPGTEDRGLVNRTRMARVRVTARGDIRWACHDPANERLRSVSIDGSSYRPQIASTA